MKKSTEVVGLPIISISDGLELGNVKSLVVNPEKGTVDFLTVEHEDWQVSVKAIPFSKVIGIGEFAVTIDSDNVIIDLNEIPIANQLVNKRIKITDTRVITRKGQLLGEAKEYFLDEDNGVIIGLQLLVNDQHVFIKSENVLTFGKDILVVNEETAENLLHSEHELVKQPESDEPVAEELIEDLIPQEEDKFEDLNNQQIEVIKEKQIKLLEGKVVIKDILASDSTVLIAKDTVLTKEDIQKAQNEGPSTFVELSMNTEM
ncbi:photosystem reaction center subunit H [Metabacillus litoralis]|uniref:Photosystem reaction center subunit H n=1 Tax=Metabacillus litoralis TaxID=152268 RepID=A0A5C6VX53_9BACI|nr:PRC-barrel domain-containing protein [Metabacillus litoralis]TXC90107.1 photosystem reaction center subunit H [Metabacillus litoralis]